MINVHRVDAYALNFGVMYRYPVAKALKLGPRFGLSFCGASGYTKKDGEDWKSFGKSSLAPYVGCGIEVPVGKHALDFCIDYKCLHLGKVNMLQATVGFRI